MFRLTNRYGTPIFIEHEGKVLTVYCTRKANSSSEGHVTFDGPRDYLIIRRGAKCTWPKVEDTVLNTPTKKELI